MTGFDMNTLSRKATVGVGCAHVVLHGALAAACIRSTFQMSGAYNQGISVFAGYFANYGHFILVSTLPAILMGLALALAGRTRRAAALAACAGDGMLSAGAIGLSVAVGGIGAVALPAAYLLLAALAAAFAIGGDDGDE